MRKIKEIPKKNYLILASIVCFTLIVSITIYLTYNNQKEYENTIPILRGEVKEIEAKDVDDYLIENPNSLLYVGVAYDENSKNLEKKLLSLKNKKNLNIIYINLTDLENKKVFYDNFNQKYTQGTKLNNYPAFIIMREGKVLDLVQKNNRDLYIGDVEQLIDIYEIKGDTNE